MVQFVRRAWTRWYNAILPACVNPLGWSHPSLPWNSHRTTKRLQKPSHTKKKKKNHLFYTQKPQSCRQTCYFYTTINIGMSLLDSRCLKSVQINVTDFNQKVFLICATGLQTRSLFFVGLKHVFLSKFPEEGILLLLSPQEKKQTNIKLWCKKALTIN